MGTKKKAAAPPPKKARTKEQKVLKGSKGRGTVHFLDPDDLVIEVDADHPLYDGRSFTKPPEDFLESCMEGQIHEVNVRKNPKTDRFEVVDGRKRVLAYREINRRMRKENPKTEPILVRCRIRTGETALQLAYVMVAANEEVIKETTMNRAQKMAKLRLLNASDEIIARRFHCDVSTVKNLIALLDSTDVLQAAVEEEQVPVGLAYKLAKLPAEEQRKKVMAITKAHHQASEAGLSPRQTRRALKEAADLPKPKPREEPAKVETTKRLPDAAIQSALATPTLYGQTQFNNRFVRTALEWALGLTQSTSLVEALRDHHPRLPPTNGLSAEETL